jgi:hypothetical protein
VCEWVRKREGESKMTAFVGWVRERGRGIEREGERESERKRGRERERIMRHFGLKTTPKLPCGLIRKTCFFVNMS